MAFAELEKGLKLPKGASTRYRKLEALGRMLDGKIYDDIPFPFEQETQPGTRMHLNLRDRRPSVDFNLAYEVTQDTSAELFDDDQFPIIHVNNGRDHDEDATTELGTLFDVVNIPDVIVEAYEEGVVGSVGVVIHQAPNKLPFYEVLPGKYCQPIYRSQYSNELVAMIVTFPISQKAAEERVTGISVEERNRGAEIYWYRYIVGPQLIIDYRPLNDDDYSHLGEKDSQGNVIEFKEDARKSHGFKGRVPAVYLRNFGGRGRELDGTALWWPIRNICVEIDYTLSQAGRGLRYAADPMLFLRLGEANFDAGLYDEPTSGAGGMATVHGDGGAMVRGASQTLVGDGKDSDAKLLEINASGIKEEREFAADLREYALEVVGGMRSRAAHAGGPATGRALDKTLKPLRRLVRRQRRPYGRGLLVALADLTVYGFEQGVFETDEVDFSILPPHARYVPQWPTEDTLQGQDLLYHVQGLQLLAGGSNSAPVQLIEPEAVGERAAEDLGFHEPFGTIKGDMKPAVVPGAGPKVSTP